MTAWKSLRATEGKATGKWYFEVLTGGEYLMIGVASLDVSLANHIGVHAEGWAYSGFDGNGYKWNNNTNTAFGDDYNDSDVIGIFFDMDAGKIWWSKNGVLQGGGDPVAGTNPAYDNLSGTLYPAVSLYSAGTNATIRFDPASFLTPLLSGFSAFC